MTTHNVYDHAAIQHGFVRKALQYFYADDDITQDDLEEFAEDLPEYAETIIQGGGYDLDQRIAALEAENASLRVLVERTIKAGSELFSDPNLDPHWHWKDYLLELDEIIVAGRKALREE